MKKINTKKFGEIEIDEKNIITMPKGLPGFSGYNQYVILDREDIKPFCWFQSIEIPEIALIVMSPYIFKNDYKVDLDLLIKDMNWDKEDKEDLEVYVVINIKEKEKEKTITANLLSPIVVNTKKLEAVQFINANPEDRDLYYYPVK